MQMETIFIKYQILFSGKNKKIININSAEFAHSMVSVNLSTLIVLSSILKFLILFFRANKS